MLKSISQWSLLLLPFENYLFPGQLMLVATNTNFDISNSQPQGRFEFLRHPKTFRAAVVQVRNFKTSTVAIWGYGGGGRGGLNPSMK